MFFFAKFHLRGRNQRVTIQLFRPRDIRAIYRQWEKRGEGDKIILLHDCVHVPIFPFHFLLFKWGFLDLLRAQQVEPAMCNPQFIQVRADRYFSYFISCFWQRDRPLLPPIFTRSFSPASLLFARENEFVKKSGDGYRYFQNMKAFIQAGLFHTFNIGRP